MTADTKMRPTPEEKIRRRQEKLERQSGNSLDNALEDTFPASDPVEATQPAPGPKDRKPGGR